ncbi:MAG: hypothetical protein ACXAB4_02430 [Candidatus Hodarchaeales archaeon]|jgi:hypothetical protein
MNIPKVGFGKGFVNARRRLGASAHLYPVDVSNGMPIISNKKPIIEKKKKKWIKDAISKPGALRQQLKVPEGQKIPAKKLASAAKKGGKLGQRARLAQTLGKLGKGNK